MKIAGLSYRLGHRVVSNDEIIDRVRTHSTSFSGNLAEALEQISFYLNLGGARERRWLADDQRPIDMICEAAHDALQEGGVEKSDIGLIIHVGLGRAFMEAGQSYFIAQALGLRDVHCFDLMDACNSWSRAMFLANTLLKCGPYEHILIVNTECNMLEGGICNPTCFKLDSFDAIDYCFAGMTLADGVSATLLSRASEDAHEPWHFQFNSRADLADICAVPTGIAYAQFAKPSTKLAVNGIDKFTSFAKPMNRIGFPICLRMLRQLPLDRIRRVFFHGHHKTVWDRMLEKAGTSPKKNKWNTYERIGNLASACVPVAIKMAHEAHDIQRGERLATLVGSGGMSFSTIEFTY